MDFFFDCDLVDRSGLEELGLLFDSGSGFARLEEHVLGLDGCFCFHSGSFHFHSGSLDVKVGDLGNVGKDRKVRLDSHFGYDDRVGRRRLEDLGGLDRGGLSNRSLHDGRLHNGSLHDRSFRMLHHREDRVVHIVDGQVQATAGFLRLFAFGAGHEVSAGSGCFAGGLGLFGRGGGVLGGHGRGGFALGAFHPALFAAGSGAGTQGEVRQQVFLEGRGTGDSRFFEGRRGRFRNGGSGLFCGHFRGTGRPRGTLGAVLGGPGTGSGLGIVEVVEEGVHEGPVLFAFLDGLFLFGSFGITHSITTHLLL